jgi:hypothetical protein
MVWGQSRQIVHNTPSQPIPGHSGVNPSSPAMCEADIRRIWGSRSGQAKSLWGRSQWKKAGCGDACLSSQWLLKA